jgi:hypothetical protein
MFKAKGKNIGKKGERIRLIRRIPNIASS